MYAEIAALENTGESIRAISLGVNGDNNQTITIRFRNQPNTIGLFMKPLSPNNLNLSTNIFDVLNFNKIALKYKSGQIALWINGSEVITSTNTLNVSGLNNLSFNSVGGSNFYGKTKALAVYKEALTDANLRCLTYPNPVATTFDLDFDTIAEQFTFTRGSEATFVNEQGLIESTNQIGPELVVNGDFATDSDWNKGTSWAISGGKANYNAVTTSSELRQLMPSIAVGKTIKVQFDVLDVAATKDAFFKLECSGSPESIFGYTKFSQGTYTYYHTITSGFDRLTFTPLNSSTGGAFSIDNVSVKEVTTATNTPRIDYSTGEKAFLLEPQSTNLINYSEDFSNSSWGKTNSSITSNSIISPDGTLNADKLVENTST